MIPTMPNTFKARVETVTPRAARSTVRSPFTATAEQQDWGGRWWEFDIELSPRKANEGREMAAFFAKVIDVGRFIAPISTAKIEQNIGNVVVDGGDQTGSLLSVRGFLPSLAPALASGAMITLGSEDSSRLHMITASANSAPDGRASLSIFPALRYSPLDGATVEVNNPFVLLEMTDPVPDSVHSGDVHHMRLAAREYL